MIKALETPFLIHGGDAVHALKQAQGLLYTMVQSQAAVLSFIDDCSRLPSLSSSRSSSACGRACESSARGARQADKGNHENTSGWHTAHRVAEGTAGLKVLIEEGADRVLGALLLGRRADEVISILGVAVRHGLSADDLKLPDARRLCPREKWRS